MNETYVRNSNRIKSFVLTAEILVLKLQIEFKSALITEGNHPYFF